MAWAFSLWCLLWRLLAIDVKVHGQTEIQDTFCNGRGMINSNLTCSCFSGFRGPDCSLSESYAYVYRTVSKRRVSLLGDDISSSLYFYGKSFECTSHVNGHVFLPMYGWSGENSLIAQRWYHCESDHWSVASLDLGSGTILLLPTLEHLDVLMGIGRTLPGGESLDRFPVRGECGARGRCRMLKHGGLQPNNWPLRVSHRVRRPGVRSM